MAALMLLGGCATRPAHPRDELQVAISVEPATLDPLISADAPEFSVEAAVFDGLLRSGPDGKLRPDLATEVPTPANGGVSPDLKTITYHLRRGVVWQDGVPFDARDVAFTYRMLIDPRVASPYRSIYEQIASLQTPSRYTVVVRLRKPSFAAIHDIFVAGLGSIVPWHVLRRAVDVRRSAFNGRPVGTGPYAVRDWKRGDHIALVANERYFAGTPRIPKIRLLVVPDAPTRAAMLGTGAVDVASLRQQALPALRTRRSLRLFFARSDTVFFLDLNTKRAPFDDRRMREALADAVDHAELAKGGTMKLLPAYSILPGYNVPCARARLARPKALPWARTPPRVELAYPAGPIMGAMALELAQAWERIGVHTTIRSLPYGALYGDGGAVIKGRFQIAIDEFALDEPNDVSLIVGSANVPPVGFNYTRYRNRNVDRWLAQADSTFDPNTRRRLYEHVRRALCADVPLIPLAWGTYSVGIDRRLKGFVPQASDPDLSNVVHWSLRK